MSEQLTKREIEVLEHVRHTGCMVVTHRTATGQAVLLPAGSGVSWPRMLQPMVSRGWIEYGPLVPIAEHFHGFDPHPAYPDPWSRYHRRGRLLSITALGRDVLEQGGRP
ncbi:MAG: hypothetical protein ACRDQD_00665 [Nocardioidaceae bacterium]